MALAIFLPPMSETDLNVRATFLHLMGDVASTAAAVVAGVLIYYTGANWLDSLASVFIGMLLLYNAWGILRESVSILLEFTPRDVDMTRMVGDMLGITGVLGVHDLHVWSLTTNLRTMSAHVLTEDVSISAGGRIQRELDALLAARSMVSPTRPFSWNASLAAPTDSTADSKALSTCMPITDAVSKKPRRARSSSEIVGDRGHGLPGIDPLKTGWERRMDD